MFLTARRFIMAFRDSDYASLGAALTAAAGDVLLITQDQIVASTHAIPPCTRLLGWGGWVTATTDSDIFNAGGNGVEVDGLRGSPVRPKGSGKLPTKCRLDRNPDDPVQRNA
jgi:hypothetical protein